MNDNNLLVGELKERREAMGLTTQQVSERCGLDHQRLIDWEGRLGSPRIDEFQRWVEALDLKISLVSSATRASQGLRVDWTARRVTVDGAPVRLTPMEWKALERLAWMPGELVTHEDLFRHLYGTERHYRAQSTAVRVLITKLRRILPLKIEAQWRRGYVVTGLEPSRSDTPAATAAVAPERDADVPATPAETMCSPRPMINIASEPTRNKPPMLNFSSPGFRQLGPAQTATGLARSEELGVIERFLAERGATRCPDVATIQHQPLPTLVWDKVKRKWVRPLQVAGTSPAN
ncbi:MAG: winged helix-turn-helix domain-containing protein [Alphaproteobacteria bacterium]|nr:winged helix-turn-helix domain-containing protein [Alphaproteobacteria bacterium]